MAEDLLDGAQLDEDGDGTMVDVRRAKVEATHMYYGPME